MKTAFIGHGEIYANDICERLIDAIQAEIDVGCRVFTMGTHGEFDRLALYACRRLRDNYKDLEIEVVITSLNAIRRVAVFKNAPYADVQTIMYDNVSTILQFYCRK